MLGPEFRLNTYRGEHGHGENRGDDHKPKTDPVTHAPERNIHFYFAVRRLSIQLSGVFHIEKKQHV